MCTPRGCVGRHRANCPPAAHSAVCTCLVASLVVLQHWLCIRGTWLCSPQTWNGWQFRREFLWARCSNVLDMGLRPESPARRQPIQRDLQVLVQRGICMMPTVCTTGPLRVNIRSSDHRFHSASSVTHPAAQNPARLVGPQIFEGTRSRTH